MTTQRVELLVIGVHYRTPTATARFANDVRRQVGSESVATILVDNSPSPDGDAIPRSVEDLTNTRVLYPGVNLGYFRAATYALDHYLSHSELPDWVVVTNTDIEFADSDVLGLLLSRAVDAGTGVIAPSIRSSITGRNQNPYMRSRPSPVRMRFYSLVFSLYVLGSAYQTASWVKARLSPSVSRLPPDRGECPLDIYAPHGSFIAFHKNYFHAGGGLVFKPFLFGEEIHVAEQARRLKLKVLYEPRLRLIHTEHSSMGGIWNRRTARYRRDAARYIAESYF